MPIVVFLTGNVYADEDKNFTLNGELGLTATSGNTDSSSVLIKLNATHELEDWSNDYKLEARHKKQAFTDSTTGETNDQTSEQKFGIEAQGDYKLQNPDHRVFLFAEHKTDRFSTYDNQTTIAGGWSQQVWKRENSQFKYSIGPGYTFVETNDGLSSDEMILRSSAEYVWNISDNAQFRQVVSTNIGDSNTISESDTSISAKLNGSLAMKFSFQMDHNSNVAEDKENLDIFTSITLVYSFF